MTTEAKKLTDAEREAIFARIDLKHCLSPKSEIRDDCRALRAHIDALAAESAAQQAELAAIRKAAGQSERSELSTAVFVERLAREKQNCVRLIDDAETAWTAIANVLGRPKAQAFGENTSDAKELAALAVERIAELARLKSCEGVDVEKLARESWSEYVSIGKEKGWLVQQWENMDESYREGATRFVRHIVSQLPLCQPRPFPDAEVERLAEGARAEWASRSEGLMGDLRRVVRYLAAELPAAESAELADLRAKLAGMIDPRETYDTFECPSCGGSKEVYTIDIDGKDGKKPCDFCGGFGFTSFAQLDTGIGELRTKLQAAEYAIVNEESIARQLEDLRKKEKADRDRLLKACEKQQAEISEILGRALGYQEHEQYGLVIGDHVAESLASEAAEKLAELRAKLNLADGANFTLANAVQKLRVERDQLQQRAKAAERERECSSHQRKLVESICEREGVSAECSDGLRSVSGRVRVLVQRAKTEAAKLKDERDRLKESNEWLHARLNLYETAAAHLSEMVDDYRQASDYWHNAHASDTHKMGERLRSMYAELADAKRELAVSKENATGYDNAATLLEKQLAATQAKLDGLVKCNRFFAWLDGWLKRCGGMADEKTVAHGAVEPLTYGDLRMTRNAWRMLRGNDADPRPSDVPGYVDGVQPPGSSAALADAKCSEPKTRNFAEVIRRQAADDAELAAGIAQAADDADREQAEFEAAAEIIERHGYQVISDSLEESCHSVDATEMVDAEDDNAYVSPPPKEAGTIQVRYTDGGRLKPLLHEDGEQAPMLGSEQPAFVCPECKAATAIRIAHDVCCQRCGGYRVHWSEAVRAAREPAQPTGWAWAAMWERQDVDVNGKDRM